MSRREVCFELGLQPLKQKRRNHRLSLLMKTLQDEERHSTLLVAHDEITEDRQKMTMTTRFVAPGEMMSVYAASQACHGSFLPRTTRDTREDTN